MIWEMQVCEVAVRTESEAWVCTEQQLPLGPGCWCLVWFVGYGHGGAGPGLESGAWVNTEQPGSQSLECGSQQNYRGSGVRCAQGGNVLAALIPGKYNSNSFLE